MTRLFIHLFNSADILLAKQGFLKMESVRQIEVESIVDSGAAFLMINENVKSILGLDSSKNFQPVQLADGQIHELELVGPIEIRFKNRRCVLEAIVLPGNEAVRLGFMPIGAMDLLFNGEKRRLILPPTRPNRPQFSLK